jgi:regulator of protease activity HflC (stomatin/prohibitin superfamily)
MLGFRYIKFDPTQHVIVFKGGAAVKEGPGLAFWYFAPSTSLVSIPLGSTEAHFIFQESTADFQEVTIQGQVTYRISDPKKAAALLNYTLDPRGYHYASKDPEKLQQRVVNAINVLAKSRIQKLSLREAMTAGDTLVGEMESELTARQDIQSLGLEILGLSILAIKPTPDTARALEAETREQLLKEADDAVFTRRNASVEHERSIKENELRTEQAVQEKRHQIEKADTTHQIQLEESRRSLVDLEAANARTGADARAYALEVVLKAMAASDPKLVQALASVRMQPDALIAAAMTEFAANAEKIGELNLSPDLLRDLLNKKK